MKKIVVVCLVLAAFFCSDSVFAQQKPVVKIETMKQVGDMVNIALTSTKKFIAGGNIYMLYIGDKEFRMSNHQFFYKGKGNITFPVSKSDFSALADGASVYLTYGRIIKAGNTDQEKEELTKEYPHCWSLGKLNKKLLTK